eukprot:7328255-Prymnesium_polylepis.1
MVQRDCLHGRPRPRPHRRRWHARKVAHERALKAARLLARRKHRVRQVPVARILRRGRERAPDGLDELARRRLRHRVDRVAAEGREPVARIVGPPVGAPHRRDQPREVPIGAQRAPHLEEADDGAREDLGERVGPRGEEGDGRLRREASGRIRLRVRLQPAVARARGALGTHGDRK